MASGDPRDPVYGLPYTGTPVVPAAPTYPYKKTVLDMYRMTRRTITITGPNQHRTADGDLFHQ